MGDAHCTSANIRDGLGSAAARHWRKAHLPDVNLDPCFTVYHPGQTGHDSECTDIAYISRHTQQAMGVMYLNNVTIVGQQLWCRYAMLLHGCLIFIGTVCYCICFLKSLNSEGQQIHMHILHKKLLKKIYNKHLIQEEFEDTKGR